VKSPQRGARTSAGDRRQVGMSTNAGQSRGLLNELSAGRPGAALFREALSLSREEGDRSGEALALNNIGPRTSRRASSPRPRRISSGRSTSASRRRYHGRWRIPPQPRRDAGPDGEVRPGAHSLFARARPAADRRDTRAAAWSAYQHRDDLRLPGPLRRRGQVEGRGLQAFRELKQRDTWFGEILSAWAAASPSPGARKRPRGTSTRR